MVQNQFKKLKCNLICKITILIDPIQEHFI
jgi:hypothetical protein